MISGTQTLAKHGKGTFEISGAGSNTYSGNFVLRQGTLLLNKAGTDVALASATVNIGDEAGGGSSDILRYGAAAVLINFLVP